MDFDKYCTNFEEQVLENGWDPEQRAFFARNTSTGFQFKCDNNNMILFP